MKVLVAGGTGIIGTGIVEAAVRKGHSVIAVSRQLKPIHDKRVNCDYVCLDWNDTQSVKEYLDKNCFDVIVDGLVFNEKQIKRDLELVEGHCKHYIYISTAGVYEQPAHNVDENGPKDMTKVIWPYSVNKRKAEIILEQNYENYSFMMTTIRPGFTYGDTRIPCAVVGRANQWTLLNRMIEGKPLVFVDDAHALHAITHISTLSNAVVGMFLKQEADRQVFHVSDNKAYTWEEVIQTAGKVLGVEPKIVYVSIERFRYLNFRLYNEIKYNKMQELTLNNGKIKSVVPDIDYEVPLEEGLQDTIQYLQDNYADKVLDYEFDKMCDMILCTQDYKLSGQDAKMQGSFLVGMTQKDIKKLRRDARLITIKNYCRERARNVKKLFK